MDLCQQSTEVIRNLSDRRSSTILEIDALKGTELRVRMSVQVRGEKSLKGCLRRLMTLTGDPTSSPYQYQCLHFNTF